MIMRVFRGLVRAGMEEPYARFLHDEGFPELRSHPGLVSLHASTPAEGDRAQLFVTSMWTGLDRLVSFAGKRWREAKIMPGEAAFLREKNVYHYETIHYEAMVPEPATRVAPKPPGPVVDAGVLQVDLVRKVVTIDGEALELPPLEFALLTELALRPDEPVPAVELVALVWPPKAYVTTDDLRRLVYRLRRLLGAHGRGAAFIRHRRGYGYLLDTSSTRARER